MTISAQPPSATPPACSPSPEVVSCLPALGLSAFAPTPDPPAVASPVTPAVRSTAGAETTETPAEEPSSFWNHFFPREVSYFQLPIYDCLRGAPFHCRTMGGEFQRERMIAENLDALLRSDVFVDDKGRQHVNRLIFRFGSDVFVSLDEYGLSAYAPTPETADRTLRQFHRYAKVKAEEKPTFYIINVREAGVEAHPVEIDRPVAADAADLALHYGEGFVEWERQWMTQFCSRPSGITVFTGPPGVGKTSYVKSLLASLAKTHRFFFVPITNAVVLSNPEFVTFWLRQGRRYPHRKVVILEDAESLMLPRDDSTSGKVSNLLQIGDGLLGEFAKVQVLATANCTLRELDPALTRPGRLIGWREFRRLTRREADRLAVAKGLRLPEQPDFSLAEIYNAPAGAPISAGTRHIGFEA